MDERNFFHFMKTQTTTHCTIRPLLAALVVGSCVLASATFLRAETSPGDDSSPSNTRDSTGVVTAISPGADITVASRRGPFTYQFGNDVHVFGADSKPTSLDQVHRGERVTVYYYHRGGAEKVARIVVLGEQVTKVR